MSYDLHFTGRGITQDEFQEYFQGRGHYMLSDTEAWYQNNDTGVYFGFSWAEEPDDHGSSLSFNLNLFRPHIFGLEAEPELSALTAHFGFTVFDPQGDGVGGAPYAAETFLKNWNGSNARGYRVVLQAENAPGSVWTLPTERIEAYWRWNFQKAALQKDLDPEVFVPSVMFVSLKGKLHSAAVWPYSIPTLLPQVDTVVAIGDNLENPDMRLLPWARLETVLDRPPRPEWALPAYELKPEILPAVLADLITHLPPLADRPEGVTVDKILNRELVEAYSTDRPA